ncbi:intradiol ring-cleavage dioxygenase [Methylobacterium planeticum]|uniref:Intradiol ring-cleavage dioxygenase n=1 Tax=Methylobacterium planeticum TaxID=2615211 RepID=A0A6N6N0B8_9HYPH|nr:intradiol ring-cleavage dioxygenase [Methylobacterium planeticum]KAB1075645.1 intradiol ring-cleavage dioxygenase [Methylobacterium planeticum]
MDRPAPTSRRALLATLGGSLGALLPSPGRAAPAAIAPAEEGACRLTPQAIEGPFYHDPKLIRADIAEGRVGVPLRLRLRLIEAGPCTPVPGARVDVWHCDARGLYSGYPGQGDSRSIDTRGETFLRGSQVTDAAGFVTFETIYPGWYAGRATHIHVKAFLDARTMLTGQIYFPDALNEFLYTQVPAYTGRRAERFVVNANEEDPNRRAFCAVKEERDRYAASLTLGVDRSADRGDTGRAETPSGRPERPPPPPGGGAGPGPGFRGPGRLALKDRLGALVPGLRRER